MKILAIETSCDETSAAVIKDGKEILSNIVSSQVEFHKKYGGIVPEVASRKHIEVISAVIKQALDEAKLKYKNIDGVAATYGPGLVGSLIVGLNAAKAIAYSINKPFIGINHLEGHIYANFLNSPPFSPSLKKRGGRGVSFPFVCLVVSGGHTNLMYVKDHGQYELLGRTRDDAAGEAFDKVARFLGIGYPGGPIIDKMSKNGNPKAIDFPRAMLARRSSKSGGGMDESFEYDFSFSGLKTAVVNYVRRNAGEEASGETSSVNRTRNTKHNTIRPTPPIDAERLPDLVASFQQAAVDTLVEKTIRAAKDKQVKWIALAGGVSANSQLREDLKIRAEKEGLNIAIPPLNLCTDNAAMIGCAGYYRLKNGEKSDFDLPPVSALRI